MSVTARVTDVESPDNWHLKDYMLKIILYRIFYANIFLYVYGWINEDMNYDIQWGSVILHLYAFF